MLGSAPQDGTARYSVQHGDLGEERVVSRGGASAHTRRRVGASAGLEHACSWHKEPLGLWEGDQPLLREECFTVKERGRK